MPPILAPLPAAWLALALAAPLATLGSLVLCLLFFAKRRRQAAAAP